MTTASTTADLGAQLARELAGRVVTPADSDYDALRRVADGASAEKRPAFIAPATSIGNGPPPCSTETGGRARLMSSALPSWRRGFRPFRSF